MQLICRNRVTDFNVWRRVFVSHAEAHVAAGLHLRDLWVNADDPDEVFFVFDVDDRDDAQAFMDTPLAAQGAKLAGVIDRDYWFVLQSRATE
jgi:hypothetical protein